MKTPRPFAREKVRLDERGPAPVVAPKQEGAPPVLSRANREAPDCDADAALHRARQTSPACHEGRRSCFDPR